MKNPKIKCVLFDADGVIVNAEMFSVQYQREHGITNEEMLPFYTGVFQECLIGKADLKEVIEKWLIKWKWEGTIDEFLEAWFKAEHKIDERIIEVIKSLQAEGIKCFLITNQEEHRTQYMKKQMGFEKIFDGIFSSAEIGYKKPEKEFYEYILNNLKNKHKVSSEEIIFFDDEQENVDGAKILGIGAYLYEGFKEFKKII